MGWEGGVTVLAIARKSIWVPSSSAAETVENVVRPLSVSKTVMTKAPSQYSSVMARVDRII